MNLTISTTPEELRIYNKFWAGVARKNYNTLTSEESKIIRYVYSKQYNNDIENGRQLSRYDLVKKSGFLCEHGNYPFELIGDHGVYLEFTKANLTKELITPPDQAWRKQEPYVNNVKYFWYEPEGIPVKVYLQTKTVKYADYKVGFYYVDPYEIQASLNF